MPVFHSFVPAALRIDARISRQRIGIKEFVARERKPAQRRVIDGKLHDINVAAIGIEVEHAMRPKRQRDCGAGLAVSGLGGHIVGKGETLVVMRRTDPAMHIHLMPRQVVPENARQPK